MPSIEVAVAEPAELGECPVWSAPERVLYWADIDGKAIHRFDPSTGLDERRQLSGRPGSFALTTDPGVLLVALEHEMVWMDWSTGETTPWLSIEQAGQGVRLNDGRTDPQGRFWVGSMFADVEAGRRAGSLHRIDSDGTHTTFRHGVGVANGLGFDPDRSLMYFADTPTREVLVWDYDPELGEPTNERQFFDYSTTYGLPDGACVDSSGCYWSASVFGWGVVRITPDGVVDQRIDLPVAKPTMPAFGGADLDVLFVTSIPDDGPPTERSDPGVAPGALLAIDLSAQGISGRLEAPFKR